MTPRKFIPTEVKFTLRCREEIIPIRGNALASGDDEVDRKAEDAIIADLENGNQWAWCAVTVQACWTGFTGQDHLGGCSCESEEAFRQPGSYFEDMIGTALADLLTQIREAGWAFIATNADLAAARRHGFENVERLD